jgi:hypothetical protein
MLLVFFASIAHAVVLENAGIRGLNTKRCFLSRLYSPVLLIRAPESRERGAQHFGNHIEGDWCCDTTSTAGRATLLLLAEGRTLALEEFKYAFKKLAANFSVCAVRICAAFLLQCVTKVVKLDSR